MNPYSDLSKILEEIQTGIKIENVLPQVEAMRALQDTEKLIPRFEEIQIGIKIENVLPQVEAMRALQDTEKLIPRFEEIQAGINRENVLPQVEAMRALQDTEKLIPQIKGIPALQDIEKLISQVKSIPALQSSVIVNQIMAENKMNLWRDYLEPVRIPSIKHISISHVMGNDFPLKPISEILPQINLESLIPHNLILDDFITKTKHQINLTNDFKLKEVLNLSLSLSVFQADSTSKLLSKIFRSIDNQNILNSHPILSNDILKVKKIDDDISFSKISSKNKEEPVEFSDEIESEYTEEQEINNSSKKISVDEDVTSLDVVPNLLDIQQQELIGLSKSGSKNNILTLDEIYLKSHAYKVHQKVIDIGKLVYTCNNICKAKSKDPIFKITEILSESVLDLTHLVAEDSNSFFMIIQSLYKILYQGSGTKKPLYLSGTNPILSQSESKFIGHLKIFRDKWIAHNTDRKNQDGASSDWEKISESLKWFGLDTIPYTKSHFKQLHWSVLDEAQKFLLLLASKL